MSFKVAVARLNGGQGRGTRKEGRREKDRGISNLTAVKTPRWAPRSALAVIAFIRRFHRPPWNKWSKRQRGCCEWTTESPSVSCSIKAPDRIILALGPSCIHRGRFSFDIACNWHKNRILNSPRNWPYPCPRRLPVHTERLINSPAVPIFNT